MKIVNRAKFIDIMVSLAQGPMTFNELRRKLKISPSTLSRRISEMEKYKLVSIIISKDDKKRIKYTLTEKGEETIPLIKKWVLLSNEIDTKIRQGENS